MTTQIDSRTDLAMSSAQLNLLANGGFEQWHSRTSFVSPAHSTFLMDGWYWRGNGVATVTRESGTGNYDSAPYSAKVVVATTQAGQMGMFAQSIGGFGDLLYLPAVRSKTMSLSVRIKCDVASSVRIGIDDGPSQAYSSYHTGDNTWQTLTVTKTMASNASGASIYIGAIQSSANDLKAGTWYVDSAILIIGSSPIDFIPDLPEIDKVKVGALSAAQQNMVNLIDNGGFGAGQKYSGIVYNPSSTQVVIDRWKCQFFTNSVQPTFSQQRAGVGDRAHCLRHNISVAGSTAVGDDRFAYQACYTLGSDFRGKPVSVSAWMMSNRATAGIEFRYGLGLTVRTYHSGGGGWEYLTATGVIDAAYSQFSVAAFANPLDTGDVWLDDVMVVAGNTPVPYRPLSETEDLMRCQRYYEALSSGQTYNPLVPIQSSSSSTARVDHSFKVSKFTIPTITVTLVNAQLWQSPTQGSGSSTDTVNYTPSSTGVTTEGFTAKFDRGSSQTSYNILELSYRWVAEVT